MYFAPHKDHLLNLLSDCTALLDTENSLLKHVHGTHRSVGELCTIALPTQLMPLTELPTFPPEPVPVYHEYQKLVRPAVISKAKREKLTPEVRPAFHLPLACSDAMGTSRYCVKF